MRPGLERHETWEGGSDFLAEVEPNQRIVSTKTDATQQSGLDVSLSQHVRTRAESIIGVCTVGASGGV